MHDPEAAQTLIAREASATTPCSALLDAIDGALCALRLASKRHDEDRGTTGMFDLEIDRLEQESARFQRQNDQALPQAGRQENDEN